MIKTIKIQKTTLIVSASFFLAFLVFTLLVSVVDVSGGVVPGTEIGFSSINLAFYRATQKSGAYTPSLYKISEYLGYLALIEAAAFAVYGVMQAIKRKSVKKADADVYALAAIYVLTAVFYVVFEVAIVNYRPVVFELGKIEASYPSSHTVLSCVIVGTGALMLRRRISRKSVRIGVELCSALVVVATVACRAFCGVHYLTDIVGGLLLSASLVTLFAAFSQHGKATEA